MSKILLWGFGNWLTLLKLALRDPAAETVVHDMVP